ncbi:MAG: SF1B family DNA helicase RecD2, partial [Tumebacillaceae bacterium]
MKDLLGGQENTQETLEGTVKRITFQNEENGFTIATLTVESHRDPVPIVGTMPGLSGGEQVRVRGKWHRHEKFGMQLQVEAYERILPVTTEGIEKFLASGSIKGIGPATAKKIVAKFGLETLDVIEREPDRLQEIEGIGKAKAQGIVRGFTEHRGVQSVMLYLGTRGVSPAMAEKLYKRYGAETIEVLEQNPYRMVDEVRGIGFKTADKLAQQLGLPLLSPQRMKIGLKHVLQLAADEGHVYLPEEELLAKATQLLGTECAPHLTEMLRSLASERTGGVIVEQVGQEYVVFLAGFYFSEMKVADYIRTMVSQPVETDEVSPTFIDEVEQQEGLSLAPLQRQAVEAVLTERLVVITGGPGTGKTTTVRAMIAALKRQGITPVLAAPTGRAAKRMRESTGEMAKTLHRLLEYGNAEGEGLKFQRNEENRLEGKVFIIDEASMIDLLLCFQLLRALPDDARLVLCGDIDQLPS